VTSSWFFILQLSQDARSNKHQIGFLSLGKNICWGFSQLGHW